MTDDLMQWLGQQLDEDGRANASPYSEAAWHALDCDQLPDGDRVTYPCTCGVPARALREVEAKRILVAEHDKEWCPHCMDDPNGCPTRRAWVLPYADRPGYREEWRP
ncbi:DUF6221 family protein [Streptomyces sp. NPDC006640]|uniref:DUF6221 family protein n=1 Tax=unclassified Streptomyces TaxID=2593676 RepID=UPI0036CDCBE6